MNNPTMENVLNLALDATPQELARSEDLNVGFDSTEKIWELIVKYSGSLTGLSSLGVTVTELLNEYAILTVPESLVERLALVPEIEYIEKPKRLFFSVNQGKAASCIPAVQNARYDLYGDGVLVALLDSGVDYAHPDFRNEDGTTRILALWDQTIPGRPPEGYRIGTEYTQQEINEALAADTESARYALVPSRDVSGHGTRVLGIAAGNGRASGGRYRGIASRSPILAVKLGMPREEGFPRTTELMQGVDYCIRKALELRLPVVVNISIGNTYGAHDGTSLLETYIADIANVWKSVICIGTGNEGYAAGHAAGILQERTTETVELAVGEYETAFSIQIWKSYLDEVDITLISPGGRRAGPIQKLLGAQRFVLEETEILLYYGEPSPYSQSQEIYLELLPRGDYVDTGIWTLELAAGEIRDGHYHIWLPSSAALNGGTRFLRASADTTLTIPSTARRIAAIGAYDSRTLTYADFSGRGGTCDLREKPVLVAPGVRILTTAPGGTYAEVTGTSFATPFATGAAALLLQWGIVDGNDPYLYGEKAIAFLKKGTRPLPAYAEYPNPEVGWGSDVIIRLHGRKSVKSSVSVHFP
ncbi:S8 family peptidase [Laedolimicola ammoniilytica]|uniref:S8 family serine peptidase n=1 Tax=Laedolimicola ammoniilytica TaxID=2981771 RepID=A0ABT2RZ58_9FIRM|nr:S8 family peptidase [Laedolimicola ammoniilytica]MCU6697621.1 S8 family serine peptidase [Laedolimicola ammoniilytica]SCI36560.1 Serine protease AprX [uncultured Clostridium sp.]